MNRVFEAVAKLSEDGEFASFQHEVVQAAYDALGQSYAAKEHEVATVTRLVEALGGKSHKQVHIEASKIHGSRSFVEFNFRDKPTTKELGDMAIISLVTAGKERLVQRLCIIQNKNIRGDKWDVDEEQLFLLKNFPPFTGNRGIFRGMRDVAFQNRSGCLGAYGLFHEPGEMVFASAAVTAECLRGGKSLQMCDAGPRQTGHVAVDGTGPWGGSLPFHRFHPEEWLMLMEKAWHRYGPFSWPGSGIGLPFLGNVHFSRDIYDFIRDWTQMNIGEFTCWAGVVVNQEVDGFANHLIRSAKLGHRANLPLNDQYGDRMFDASMAVFVLHYDVGPKG